jgi:phosphatidylglycerol:prolipoprotein diacylglycerol transferase
MHPILIEFGSFSIRWYGVMAAVGFLLATLAVNMNRKRADMSEDQSSALLFIAIAGGVLGARIVYVYQNWTSQFKDHFSEIFRIDHGGLVFYGGFFLAMAGIIFYCRKSKLDMVKVMDVFSPALAIGHAMGRIGCFLNGCCYGKPTQCFLGVHYPEGSAAANKFMGAAVHPVQLYETCGNILLAVFLLLLLRKAKRGITMASYMLLYGILRFSDEFFRGDHRLEQLWFGKFTPAQTVGMFLIPTGLLTLIYFLRKNGKQNNQTDNKQSK